MTEFDFDVITGPSGPMRSGQGACGWVSAETPGPQPISPPPQIPERQPRRSDEA